jgi:diguanylate cyclase (GGDEF)-like protein
LILVWSLVMVRRLIGKLHEGPLRYRWYAMMILISMFVIGYLGYIAAFWNEHADLLDLIVPVIFILGAGFVWLTAILSLQTVVDALRIDHLEREASTDPLTKLFNRRYLDRRLNEEVAIARRYIRPLSVLMIDIDYFKKINDKHGHQAGDQVLIAVAKLVAKSLRDTDIMARYGGEDFVVIVPHTPLSNATSLAQRIRKSVEEHDFPVCILFRSPPRQRSRTYHRAGAGGRRRGHRRARSIGFDTRGVPVGDCS